MEIVDITKDQMLTIFILCFYCFLIIAIIITAIKDEKNKNKNRHMFYRLFCILVIIFIISPFLITPFLCLKPTNQYTIEYNSGSLEKTITTQEIIHLVKIKDVFDKKKEKTSKIVISVPNNEKSDDFDSYIRLITENTINEREAERNNKLNEKYLNETHTVNIKK